MALRFRKSLKIAPGIRVNVGKLGASFTFGRRGSSINVGSRGVFSNIGLPGTGLSIRDKIGGGSQKGRSRVQYKVNIEGLNVIPEPIPGIDPEWYNELMYEIEQIKGTKAEVKRQASDLLVQEARNINDAIEDGINQHKKNTNFLHAFQLKEKPKGPGFLFYVFFIFCILGAFVTPVMLLAFPYFIVRYYRYRKRIKTFTQLKTTLMNLRIKSQRGNAEAVESCIEFLANNLDFFIETTMQYEVSEGAKRIDIDIDLPGMEQMPQKRYVARKTDLSMYAREIPEKDAIKQYAVYVHSLLLRIAFICFDNFPTVETVDCSGHAIVIDSSGRSYKDTMLAAVFSRETASSINLAQADPIKVYGNFDVKRKIERNGRMHGIHIGAN